MGRENYQARLEEIDARRVDEFQDEQSIQTKAEATRRLIRRGLEDYTREREQADSDEETVDERAGPLQRLFGSADTDDSGRWSMRRHGLSPAFAGILRVAVVAVAIFAGGILWELGGAFGDFLTLVPL